MRILLTTLAVVSLAGCSAAQEPKPAAGGEKAPDKPKLGNGDPAPALAVTKWVKGEPVKQFESGKVYVLDFWATWCGPCVRSMPHVNDLAAEYKGKGLTVVAVTTTDPNNSAEAVEQFVQSRGAKLDFAFALCDTPDTDKAFMAAAGQDGIPCSFVVGKDGKIAFIGHPLELDDVLPKVVAGTWRGKADIDEIAKANKAFEAVMDKADKDPAGALAGLDEFAKQFPWKAGQDALALERVGLLLRAKRFDEARAATEPLVKKFAEKRNAQGMGFVRDAWTSRDLNPGRQNVEIGLAAADAALAIEGDKDPVPLLQAAEAYFQAGKPDKAVALAEKALGTVTRDEDKEFLAKQIRKFKGEKVDEKK